MITVFKAELLPSEDSEGEFQSAHESSSFLEKKEINCSEEEGAFESISLNTDEKIDDELKRQMEQLVERKAKLMLSSSKIPEKSPMDLHDLHNVTDFSTCVQELSETPCHYQVLAS